MKSISVYQKNSSLRANKPIRQKPDIKDAPQIALHQIGNYSAARLGILENQISLMSLQQIRGNRHVCCMLKRTSTINFENQQKDQNQIQRAPTQVSNNISDSPYKWTSNYEVNFTKNLCHLNVKVNLIPDADVSKRALRRVKRETAREFKRIFDNRFRLTDINSNENFRLRVGLDFVDSGQHLTVNVHAGQGHDNLSNWYVVSKPIDRAHEMGHQIGLKDEYIDASAPSRQDKDASGVFTDHSIMGNYYNEGINKAKAKLRHGQTIAGHIGSATGRSFSTTMNKGRRRRRETS